MRVICVTQRILCAPGAGWQWDFEKAFTMEFTEDTENAFFVEFLCDLRGLRGEFCPDVAGV